MQESFPLSLSQHNLCSNPQLSYFQFMLVGNVKLAHSLMPGWMVPTCTLLQAMYSVVLLLKTVPFYTTTISQSNTRLNLLLYHTLACNKEQLHSHVNIYSQFKKKKNVKRLKCEKEFSKWSGASILISQDILTVRSIIFLNVCQLSFCLWSYTAVYLLLTHLKSSYTITVSFLLQLLPITLSSQLFLRWLQLRFNTEKLIFIPLPARNPFTQM